MSAAQSDYSLNEPSSFTELKPVPDEYSISIVPPEAVPMEWEEVYDLLEPAVIRSDYRWSMSALLGALCRGERNLWIVKIGGSIVGAATSEFIRYPLKIMLAVQFLGGRDFDEWADAFITTIERFAQESGCHGIESTARFGFWPVLKKHGWGRAGCLYQTEFGRNDD